ncbi:DUF5706 domain-containing protein [Acinetobacter sp. ANC 4945]|nr:Pycsar system effector family protein [Acinetobacter amyesii]MCL6246491.1 DUF5706 domain-containing protein [Acinetobacter amyesii]
MEKNEFYFRVLQRYDHYINLANTKASNTITLISSLAVAATGLVGWGMMGGQADENIISISSEKVILIMCFIGFGFFAFKGYLQCMQVIKPNLKPTKDPSTDSKKGQLSTIFYGHVRDFKSTKDFVDAVENTNEKGRFEDLLSQVHVLAEITADKMSEYSKVGFWVNFSFIFFLIILLLSFIIRLG